MIDPASAAAAASRLRPIVLRCPECTAPASSGQTRCTYCRVPLTWEPVFSLSTDDAIDAGREASDRGVIPVGFGPVDVVPNGAETVLQIYPQFPARPTHLYVPAYLGDHFMIHDFRIGHDSLFANANPISGSAFSFGKGMPLFEEDALLLPGLLATLAVSNVSDRTRAFHAVLRCERMDPDRRVVRGISRVPLGHVAAAPPKKGREGRWPSR